MIGGMSKDTLADWPSKSEVAERLGMHTKTLDRAINRGEIQQAYRRVAGRRPMPVLNPADVAKLEATTVQPQPFVMAHGSAEPGGTTALAAPRASAASLPALVELLQAASARPAPLPLFLTVDQAAEYTGLPVATVKALLRIESLDGLKTGRGWRIRRSDLDKI
jgi:excisionase family DNA binding protein